MDLLTMLDQWSEWIQQMPEPKDMEEAKAQIQKLKSILLGIGLTSILTSKKEKKV